MSESDWDDEAISPKTHWGEIPKDPEYPDDGPQLPDVSEDIKKAMQRNCLDDYRDGEEVMQIKDLVLPPMEPLMMYAIELHKWMTNITETIRVAELAIEMNLIPPADAKPPIPEMPDIKLKHTLNNLNFMATSPLESLQGDKEVPELSEAIVKKILIKCVATMTAHIGFEESFQSVLDVLVDVLEEFLVKISDRFVSALNEEETLNTGGFPNVIERVLIEMGFGGAKGLHDYYQCRVLKYVNVLQKRCQELDDYYSALLLPKSESPTGEIGKMFKVRIKEEEEQMETDSEMHFTEGDVFTTGYQLLNSLEAVASMQGLSDTGDGFY